MLRCCASRRLLAACMHLLRMQVLKRLPGLRKLDGVPVTQEEREAAKSG